MGRASSGNSGGGGDSMETARRRVESKKKTVVGTCFIIATSSWLYITIALYYLTAMLTFVFCLVTDVT